MRRLALVVVTALLFADLAAAAPVAVRPSGSLTLHVDARDVARKRLHARVELAVAPGPLTLLYPKWIPGEHGPSGPIVNLTGLRLTAAGREVPWTRDPADLFSFHVQVPAGAKQLVAEYDFLLPSAGDFTAGRSASDRLAVLSWNTVVLAPAGQAPGQLEVKASLDLPAGWKLATALPELPRQGERFAFAPVTLTRLIDSPVLMGAHLEVLELGTGEPRHSLAIAADSPAATEMKAEQRAGLERLVTQAHALFGARHYGSYEWLVALSDHVASFGLEHHESSDNRMAERTLSEERGRRGLSGLLSHEYVHSWNGKFRRPADIATPDYQQPMRTRLLWVYEGLTQYLGTLLPARSGLWSPDDYRENLASVAAWAQQNPGRSWRSLEDTAASAQVLFGAASEGTAWRRSVDFYDEAILIWLDVELTLRRLSGGKRSLDDFCRKFHGGPEGPYVVKPYTFDEVVATLQGLAPFDWREFFAARVERVAPAAPLGGLSAGGYRLTFTDQPNQARKDREERDKLVDERASIGVEISEDGRLRDVAPGSASAKAGLAPGMKLVAVNGRRYSAEILRAALRATAKGGALELLAENDEYFHTAKLDYHDGLRYPHLVRDENLPDLLALVLAPR